MKKTYKDFSGIILAGGRSSRMGFPKQFLEVNGRKMIDIVLEVCKSFFDEIVIVTDDKSRFGALTNVIITEDLVKGCGPLGGIYTGLKTISHNKAFCVACDMPFLHTGLVSRLLEAAKDDNYSCVIPYSSKGIEPLHSVYSKVVIEDMEVLLRRREFQIRKVLGDHNCKYVKSRREEDGSFFNVNTKKDLKETIINEDRYNKNR